MAMQRRLERLEDIAKEKIFRRLVYERFKAEVGAMLDILEKNVDRELFEKCQSILLKELENRATGRQ